MLNANGPKKLDLNKLPLEAKREVMHKITLVIHESYTKPADEDYISARFFAHRKMTRAFFWAASQAIEKYLKAFLLMHEIKTDIPNGHDICYLFKIACEAEPTLRNLKTDFNNKIKIKEKDDYLRRPNTKEFIDLIGKYGTADNRYNASGVIFNTGYLFALDSFIYGLRKKIPGSYLYTITRSADEYLKRQFELYNGWFSDEESFPELPNKDFTMIDSGAFTILQQLTGKTRPLYSEYALQWLNEHMRLPYDIRSELKDKST